MPFVLLVWSNLFKNLNQNMGDSSLAPLINTDGTLLIDEKHIRYEDPEANDDIFD